MFKLPSYYPSFDSEIPGGVYILSFDIKSLNFITDGYMKKSSHERFFRGIAWLRDFIHSMVILSRRFAWQSGLKIAAHKFLPCVLSTACLCKNDTKQSLLIMHCRMAFTKQVFPKFLNPRSDIVELRAELLRSTRISFQVWIYNPAKCRNFALKLTYNYYKLFIILSTIYRKLCSPRPSAFERDVT